MAAKRARAQEWELRVEAWRRSGDSAATFAERHGWSPHTLRWWASRGSRPASARSAEVAFVEVAQATAPSAVRAATIDVVLRNGRRLRVRGDVNPESLAALAHALDS